MEKYDGGRRMNWEKVLKANSPMLDKTNPKQKKKIKKLLQSVQPSEYMGQDFTKLGDLISEMKSLDVNKSKDLRKKYKNYEETNNNCWSIRSNVFHN